MNAPSSPSSADRYSRQTALPEIGPDGQKLLRRARVLIVGAGGLGSPVSLYLAGAGVGTIGLIDDDVVSPSNLHRQVLYAEAQTGEPKVVHAADRLRALNSEVQTVAYRERLTPDNALRLLQQYDLVVDGCDNYSTRYLIDATTHRLGIPYVYGAVQGFEGQVSVFNHAAAPHRYTDLYPTPPATSPDRSIVGMTPAVVGGVMAHEVLKILCHYGEVLAGRLWTIDLRTMQSFTLAF